MTFTNPGAKTNRDNDDDERRREDHLPGGRQRVANRQREGDGAPEEFRVRC